MILRVRTQSKKNLRMRVCTSELLSVHPSGVICISVVDLGNGGSPQRLRGHGGCTEKNQVSKPPELP